MALTLNTRYGTRATEPSIDYPTGSFKNKSAPDAVDGTPLERDWANDFLGSRDAILKAAGILANGTPETAEASQVLEALNTIYKALATETDAGISRKSTISEAQSLVNDVAYLTPKKLLDALNAAVYGHGQVQTNVTASRVLGTNYTNSTSKPITVRASGIGVATAFIRGVVNGTVVGTSTAAAAPNNLVGIEFDVGPGETYTVSQSSITSFAWLEYR